MAPAPLVASQQNAAAKSSISLVLLTGSSYIAASAILIASNKFMMGKGMFPYPTALGLLHTSFSAVFALMMFIVKPSLFTSLTSRERRVTVDGKLIRTAIFPIALFFSTQIILSNWALKYADIAFLQMLKESNVVLVYLFSVAVAQEVFRWRQAQLIVLIMFSTYFTVRGELSFSMIGFLLQGSSCLIESGKITLQGLVLSSKGKGLDILSFMLLVMPICACLFAPLVLILSNMHDQTLLAMPSVEEWVEMRWYLCGNTCAALMLNICTLLFIQCSSAVSFVLAGIIKDCSIVLVGVFFMGHDCGQMQAMGFTAQVTLVVIWSLMKTYPEEFSGGIFEGLSIVCFGLESKSLGLTKKEDTIEKYGSVETAPESKEQNKAKMGSDV
jgi:hypothetical protein